MQLMVTDKTRRNLLKAALLGMAAPVLPFGCASNRALREPGLIGCSIHGRDDFQVTIADEFGQPIYRLPLPARGHGVAIAPQLGHAAAFARRPGEFLMVFDYTKGTLVQTIKAFNRRHFYGHGVYSNDGHWLYATEGERATSRGIIGVYDARNQYQKVDELTGFGIGPHEVIIMQDGTLVVGVGGVHTDGRTPLNLSTMEPSLTYLSPEGELLDQVGLADHHLSIRHLAHDGNKTVLCGQQYRGKPEAYPSLLAMHQRGQPMVPLHAEPEQWARFNHYIASIAATNDWILATSPRGNCYGIWSKHSGELVELLPLPDASGVVTNGREFRVSSGSGKVIFQTQPGGKRQINSNIPWDNHWSAIH
ncbi:DUF1513 domain-containing protein [Vibrio sp. AK197]